MMKSLFYDNNMGYFYNNFEEIYDLDEYILEDMNLLIVKIYELSINIEDI